MAAIVGSSPLTRGKLLTGESYGRAEWLIPAHAGKTARPSKRRTNGRAHPRSRGENSPQLILVMSPRGSSPLTRGKRPWRAHGHRRRRLIPAHAGKTETPSAVARLSKAHPRSRGENGGAISLVIDDCGSSPLTRGKPQEILSTFRECGLIPAHAGKTESNDLIGVERGAHPRSRGENP